MDGHPRGRDVKTGQLGLTDPFSITLLSMTTPLLFCSHTISQK